MKLLLQEIRRNPLLWLLVFVPVALAAEKLNHEAHTLHFVLSVFAILPLAVLLSHATESVAAKTGDSVGGLMNATLGNLTELVIAIAALQAGQYTLVKASVAGAIVTNSLFMLGASFLPPEDEIDGTIDYRIVHGPLKNLWLRLRYAHNSPSNHPATDDLRAILSYTFTF